MESIPESQNTLKQKLDYLLSENEMIEPPSLSFLEFPDDIVR